MGNICSSISCNTETEFVINEYKQPNLNNYKSRLDKYYKNFEKRFNLLKYIQISEYSMMFNEYNFTPSQSRSSSLRQKHDIFTEELEIDQFINFFKIKVINHYLVYDIKFDNDTNQIFLEFLNKLFDTICKGMVSFTSLMKKKDTKIKYDKKPKKYFLIAIGMIYCQSDYWMRMNILFDTFCNDVNKLEPSVNFKTFLFVLFLVSSFAGIITIQDLSKIYKDNLKPLSQEEFVNILEVYDVNDIVRIQTAFCEDFFGESGELNYMEYREKIINNGFDWVFTSSGIRYMLEK